MPTATYKTVIHWFRRDLRLSDNTALHHASLSAEEVVPVYLLSSWKKNHAWTGPGRQKFLCGCLESLAKNIETRDGRLIIRSTSPSQPDAIEQLIKDSNAEAIFFNRDPDPFGREMEQAVRERCRSLGVEVHDHKDIVLHEPDEILTGSDTPYRVYTPYSINWFSAPKTEPLPRPKHFHTPAEISSDDLPTLAHWKMDGAADDIDILKPGERAARDRLRKALDGPLLSYDQQRNIPAADVSSHLGADLRYGTLSVREIFHAAKSAANEASAASYRTSLHTFQKQLAWREFFMAILGHYPEVLEHEFNEKWRGLPWADPDKNDALVRWQQGRTGFPIVDAGMRQLVQTGFMHNRVRMITAMFLTKDLHIDWRHGERFFLQHLIDGEVANNNGGWQWSAGTGADAAPYFRIQNPWTQTERHDPDGEYIKTWVPELAKVDAKKFTAPPKDSDTPIADDYSSPIVDHKTAREETLAMFKKHQGG
jgi:deoxyribodipyrimidine photo-lyase